MRLSCILIKVFVFSLLQSCNKELPEKPNILFITTDYHSWEDVPELTPVLKMPALDKLYNEGVVFENHYCTAPVCMPSRYTIISGTFPHTHGMWNNGSEWLPEGSPVLMNELRKAGYKTVGIGKMHFKPWDRMAGFDKRIIADCQGNWYRDTTKRDDYYYYLKEAGFTRFDYLKYQDSTDIFGVYNWPLDDTLDIDYYVGRETVRYIEEGNLTEKPWFMWVSFNGPHNPWDPPKELMDYYLEKDLPEARYLPGELASKPFSHTVTRYNYTRKVVDRIDMDPDNRSDYIKRIRAGHYGGLTWIDMQLQKIIDKLGETGKLENTIIIFTADHGAHLGDHNLIHKGTLYERSSHVPFIIWWPEVLKPKKIDGFTSHIDIFPTLVELTGGKLPAGLEGKSYLPMLSGKKNAPDRAIIEILDNTAIVTKDYKFGLYRTFREADLYNRLSDPDEFINVIDDPEYSDIIREMTEYLYKTDPTLERDIENAPEVKILPTSITLNQGESKSGVEGLNLGGEEFVIDIDLNVKAGDHGPVLTHYEGEHGFVVFMEDGLLKAGFRKWGNQQIFNLLIPEIGHNHIRLEMKRQGILKVSSDDISYNEFQTSWPKPVQPGRKEYLTGSFNCGYSETSWTTSIGSYEKGSEYTGKIEKITLTITK